MQSYSFHPVVEKWFQNRFDTPTEPQLEGWPAIQSGLHTLIAAPTGSGKTLAAFLASLDELFKLGLEGNLKDETQVIYVSPLKALSNDIHKNLIEPLSEIRKAIQDAEGKDIEIRSAVRTGDTSAKERLSIAKKPPHILVTTPESLYLLLTSVSGRKTLSTVKTLIIDEIHAVVANRRGSHLALSVERLNALVKHPLQRIGLSATQKPIEEVACFLVGTHNIDAQGKAKCKIVNIGHRRAMDLSIELPGSPLEAVMSNEVWIEVYQRLCALIQEHRTTLIFVNTRRLAERITHHLCGILGEDKVTSHHGSLSAKLRLDAESRLKQGTLKALVATSSLELGIDIGSVDLVCQIGTPRSIATCLQRVGRAEHRRGGLPKGRLFPLTRDELVECLATLVCIKNGELDRLIIPEKPLDVLAQQIVASSACEDLDEVALLDLIGAAYPYRDFTQMELDEMIHMLAQGFSTKRGRRSALIHYDAVNKKIKGRKGSRLLSLTSGGAIPDNGEYRVVLEPSETFIGTVNEDFAVESLAGDIFQLGNTSWKILQVSSGKVRVEDAHGQPPGIPFWLGEAPARTAELSDAISNIRIAIENKIHSLMEAPSLPVDPNGSSENILSPQNKLADWLKTEYPISSSGAQQLSRYFFEAYKTLGSFPSKNKLIMERFFDESGGMQLVIHSPFGARLNRAWGLALRKRFCRSFNFELQSAATDDAIVLSLGTQHSFPLDEVFRYLNSNSVRDLLVQALLDAPMFTIRWRWNASRSLALPRHRNGHKVPAPLQRMESENLLAAVFPDQLACLENIAGDRVVPDHPLVKQTIDDCLNEAMDIEGLEKLLKRIEKGEIECIARDLPEPSFFAHEILNARPYAFLDNAPLEERRTQAVYTRRASESSSGGELGILDPAAIERVCNEAWPKVANADELHDSLLMFGVMTEEEVEKNKESNENFIQSLAEEKRVTQLICERSFWVAAERLNMMQAVYPNCRMSPPVNCPDGKKDWNREEAIKELIRGRMEVIGPVTITQLSSFLAITNIEIEQALIQLETEGFVLRGKFNPKAKELEWCDRRLLARIHRLTINRLRSEIQPVTIADYQHFLLKWHHVYSTDRLEGPEGVEKILQLLDGFELPAGSWEPAILNSRIKNYNPQWLDQLCYTGRFGWGRISPPQNQKGRISGPLKSSPTAIYSRDNLRFWIDLASGHPAPELSSSTDEVLKVLASAGALFFGEIVRKTGLLQSTVEQALGELSMLGWITSDSFEGMRALLVPSEKRTPFGISTRRRLRSITSVEFAGRWSLIRSYPINETEIDQDQKRRDEAIEIFARTLLKRYGIIFRRLLEKESLKVSWFELGRVYRRLEARGEIRGGYFVKGVSGEQFALPEAIGMLRSVKANHSEESVVLSAADPLNLSGILTPGTRISSTARNRILFKQGVALVALESGQTISLDPDIKDTSPFENLLKVGRLPSTLKTYY
jgi:ATP-dependent Lhr-like helicase